MTLPRYVCSYCHAEMDLRARKTHKQICAVLKMRGEEMVDQIERWLQGYWDQEGD